MGAIILTIDRINQKQLKTQFINAIMIRKAIIQANQIIIDEYSEQLDQVQAAGMNDDYLVKTLEDLRSSDRTAESELLTFQNLLEEIGE